jgi:hypothetical protein
MSVFCPWIKVQYCIEAQIPLHAKKHGYNKFFAELTHECSEVRIQLKGFARSKARS